MKNRTWTSLLLAAALLAAAISPVTALPAWAEEELDLEEGEGGGAGFFLETPEVEGLTYLGQTDFTYADCIHIYHYEGGYKLYDVKDSVPYLQVPEGEEVPAGLEGLTILPDLPQSIYLAATASMALFAAIDGLDTIRMSSLTADNWYVEAAKEAMEEGSILFAGKYSEPDFEMLLAEGCDLAVESTMIYHSPKVQEMIEKLGIPVFIDRASYESHPLGRTEWVKVYGEMIGKEEEAEAFFQDQAQVMEDLKDFENTQKTVAFFSINTGNAVVVRKNSDYVPKMIELAGGKYALSDIEALGEESKKSSFNMTMEEFYANAVDADYLVYNAAIESPIGSIEELLAKSGLFSDFKAVQNGNVWCADRYLYQATDIVGQLIRDFHTILTDGEESQIIFLKKLS